MMPTNNGANRYLPSFLPLANGTVPIFISPGKSIGQRKNGVLAFFTLVALFQLWADYIQTGSVQLPHRWTLIALLITGLAYLVLKLIKYQTSWLKEENR